MDLTAKRGLPVAVIGGGVTGLAAAYELNRLGKRVRLFEASARIGGVVQTEITPDGWLVETGPTSLLLGDPDLESLLQQLGLASEVVRASAAAKNRYVVRGGRPLPLPHSPGSLLSTPLFSLRSKLRLLRELTKRPRHRSTDLSLAKMMEAHFGQEIVDYAVQPFTSGVYAGDPTKLSAKYAFPSFWAAEQTHGSLIRGQLATARARTASGRPRPGIISFRKGLQVLPDALAASLPPGTIERGAQVETVLSDGGWSVVWQRDGVVRTEVFSSLIFALPAHALSKISIGSLGERPFAPVDAVEHPPVAALVMGYRRADVAHPLDGFGVLAPAREKRDILGVIFSSTLFPNRAPEGHVSLTVMMGGSLQPSMALLEPSAARKLAERELLDLLGAKSPSKTFHHRLWPRAIPQYNIGHERITDSIARVQVSYPGIYVGDSSATEYPYHPV